MTMDGPDPRWSDIPDYILGVTREIWEARRVDTLHQYYHRDIVVRSPASVVQGNGNIIAATLATLAEFPDRELLGEDVIWCGDGPNGYLSSHRLLSTATHAHDGVYGRATGKSVSYRILADCSVRDSVIDDEWLVRDQGAILLQLGQEPKRWAAELIEREGGAARCVAPLTPATDIAGPYQGTGNDHPLGQAHANLLQRIMSADLAAIPAQYDRACQLELPNGITAHGHAAADSFWCGLRAALPSASFTIDHMIGRDDPGWPPRSAVRWSLTGKHDGWGRFGSPTGADVHVMGISHVEHGPRGLRRDYTLFDESAIWKQIALHTG